MKHALQADITRINAIIEKINRVEKAMEQYRNEETENAWEAYKALADKLATLRTDKEQAIKFLYDNHGIIF